MQLWFTLCIELKKLSQKWITELFDVTNTGWFYKKVFTSRPFFELLWKQKFLQDYIFWSEILLWSRAHGQKKFFCIVPGLAPEVPNFFAGVYKQDRGYPQSLIFIWFATMPCRYIVLKLSQASVNAFTASERHISKYFPLSIPYKVRSSDQKKLYLLINSKLCCHKCKRRPLATKLNWRIFRQFEKAPVATSAILLWFRIKSSKFSQFCRKHTNWISALCSSRWRRF